MVADYLLHAGERSHGMDVLAESTYSIRSSPSDDLIGKGKSQAAHGRVPTTRVANTPARIADVAGACAPD